MYPYIQRLNKISIMIETERKQSGGSQLRYTVFPNENISILSTLPICLNDLIIHIEA